MGCDFLCVPRRCNNIIQFDFYRPLLTQRFSPEREFPFSRFIFDFPLAFLTIFDIVSTVVVPRFVRDRVCARRLVSL